MNKKKTKVVSQLKATPEARRIVALRDEVNRLTKELRKSLRMNNREDVLREVIGKVVETPRCPPRWVTAPTKRKAHKPSPEVPVVMWADWHLGETVDRKEVNGINEYNMKVAEQRVERLVSVTEKLCADNHTGVYPGIVVNLSGDNVSGGLHPELRATDEEEAIPAALKAIDWMSSGIARYADVFGSVYVPCTAGNHGRNTVRPEFKRYYRKNYDWLIYQMLAKHFWDDSRVTFDIRPANEVYYRVFNMRYLMCHGDMLGVKGGDGIIGPIGPITRGEVKKSGAYSSMGKPFDKLLHGHYHSRLWLPRSTGAGSLKGYCEFTKNALGAKPDRPTQPLWFVHPKHGETAHWDIYVDDPPKKSNTWIGVMP